MNILNKLESQGVTLDHMVAAQIQQNELIESNLKAMVEIQNIISRKIEGVLNFYNSHFPWLQMEKENDLLFFFKYIPIALRDEKEINNPNSLGTLLIEIRNVTTNFKVDYPVITSFKDTKYTEKTLTSLVNIEMDKDSKNELISNKIGEFIREMNSWESGDFDIISVPSIRSY